MSGKLIVLEGNQGLGKTTQNRLLEIYCNTHNIPCAAFYFPRYDTFFGEMSAAFLRGEYGDVDDISPYFVALIFANDRLCAKPEIERALDEGKLVICDRWPTSNMAIQAAKIDDLEQRSKFIKWIETLEFQIFGLPQPNLTLYLRAEPKVSLQHLHSKFAAKHLNGKPDIEEASEELIIRSFEQYEKLRSTLPNWITVDLVQVENNHELVLSAAEVHKKIIRILKERGILKHDQTNETTIS